MKFPTIKSNKAFLMVDIDHENYNDLGILAVYIEPAQMIRTYIVKYKIIDDDVKIQALSEVFGIGTYELVEKTKVKAGLREAARNISSIFRKIDTNKALRHNFSDDMFMSATNVVAVASELAKKENSKPIDSMQT